MSQTKRKKDTLRTWVFQDFPSNNTQGINLQPVIKAA